MIEAIRSKIACRYRPANHRPAFARWLVYIRSMHVSTPLRILPLLHCCSVLAFLCLASCAWSQEKASDREGVAFFESKIRPVLVKKCYSCHSQKAAEQKKLKGNLLLDSRSSIRLGGESGPAVVPGKVKQSLLITAIRHESFEMPPKEKLSGEVIGHFVKWIEMGAPDPRTGKSVNPRKQALAAGRQYWAYRQLRSVSPPTNARASWGRNDVDAFILARLDEHKLGPAPAANRNTLIRRLYFDVLGLPPTPQEVKAFVTDNSKDAYDQLVDQVLNNQHYGERWGRHWLDVVRFGESEGSNPEEDRERRDAYQFRDAVIRSLNQDLAFDDFVRAHLTGKSRELSSPLANSLGRFARLGTRLQTNAHPNDKRFHMLDDMVSATGSAFLGMTIGCARCHDHKIDPITAEEYYRMTAVFFDLAKVDPKVGANTVKLVDQPYLLAGGSWQRPVRPVQPGFVNVLMRPGQQSEAWLESREPRDALAEWLTDVEKGAGSLLARVIVNRIWQQHFGRGIVNTPNDFGQLGDKPSHPELLEWLANELVRSGWRLKSIHKLILKSATYRQGSSNRYKDVDRDNQWLWHYRARRLEAEAIRDNILAVSGALKLEMYGPSIKIGSVKKPYIEKPSHWRRSIYLMNPRFARHPVLSVFDPVDNLQSQSKRIVSTTPSSALFLFNSDFLWQQAEMFAARIKNQVGDAREEQVKQIYLHAFARLPQAEELELGVQFLSMASPETNKRTLTRYCHTIMGLNEFIYVR